MLCVLALAYGVAALIPTVCAGILLIVAETGRGHAYAVAGLCVVAMPPLAVRALVHRGRARVAAVGTCAALSAGLVVGLYAASPDGRPLAGSPLRSEFLATARYRRFAVAALLPEIDQVKLGTYVAPAFDPIIDVRQARHVRDVAMRHYRPMEADPEFAALGTVMPDAYEDRDAAHLYAYAPPHPVGRRLPAVVFLHGSAGNFKVYFYIWKRFADEEGVIVVCPSFGFGNWDEPGRGPRGRDPAQGARRRRDERLVAPDPRHPRHRRRPHPAPRRAGRRRAAARGRRRRGRADRGARGPFLVLRPRRRGAARSRGVDTLRPMSPRLPVLVVVALGAAACVPKNKYDAAIADAQSTHGALAASLDREKADQAALADLHQQLDAAQAQIQDQAQKLADASTANQNVQAQLDQETAIDAQLRAELTRLGKNVDQMLQEKGTLSKALDDAKARLEQLRKAQAAAAAQAALFQQFIQKFKKMIDAGQLKIATRNGRLVLQLPNDVLFDSGHTAIKPAGRDALVAIASVLRTIQGRTFQVAGDTDNVPIQNSFFPSNWELSTARAVAVVKLLVAQGVDPHALSAAGYGEYDPVAGNDSADGRAKNRRIEITLQPNLDELVTASVLQ